MDLISLYHTNRKIFWLVIIASINAMAATLLTIYFNKEIEFWFTEARKEDIVFLYMALTPLVSMGLFSTTVLSVCGGYFLGAKSIIYLIPVYMIATTVGYIAGRKTNKGQLEESLMKIEETSIVLTNLYKRQWLVIFFLRVSPVLPFLVINLLLGAIRTPVWMFLSGTLAGMLPRSILAIMGGMALAELGKGFSDSMPRKYTAVLVIFICISLWFFYKLTQKKADQSENS